MKKRLLKSFSFSCNSQDENRRLLERLMQYKSKDADKLNEENESIIRYVYRKIKAS